MYSVDEQTIALFVKGWYYWFLDEEATATAYWLAAVRAHNGVL